MKQMITATITVTPRWWLHSYLCALACMCQLTGMQPDPVKLDRMLDRGIVVKYKCVR